MLRTRAGDKKTARDTLNERWILVRNRQDDQKWHQQFGDVGTTTTKEQAWTELSKNAAWFGDLNKAKAILREAYPKGEKPSFRYLLGLSRVELIASNFSAAEKSARAALKVAPYVNCEKTIEEKVEQSLEFEAYEILIEALAKQEKPFSDEVKKYRRELTSECTYLSRHTQNFYSAAIDLADFAPSNAKEFFDAGRLVDQVDGEVDPFGSAYFEEEACKALKNLTCLRAIAQKEESLLTKENLYLLDFVANAYVDAFDYDSAERLMRRTVEGDTECFQFSRHFGITQLIEDGHFSRAQKWIEEWTICRAISGKPNWQYPFGYGGNLWSDLAFSFSQLSKALLEAGRFEEAHAMAINSLAMAIETENTWRVDYLGYRAHDLGQAYGAAYGALARVNE